MSLAIGGKGAPVSAGDDDNGHDGGEGDDHGSSAGDDGDSCPLFCAYYVDSNPGSFYQLRIWGTLLIPSIP